MAITNNGTSIFVGSCVSILDVQAAQQPTQPHATGVIQQDHPYKISKTRKRRPKKQ